MALDDFVFTSEAVSEGHPDKVCDQVSDAVLDALLAQDSESRVAVEALIKSGLLVLAGEVTSNATIDYIETARRTIREIGYNAETGFDCDTAAIITAITQQSEDISQGVTEGKGLFTEQGAGDQGMMFGFACRETPQYMPLPISLANQLVERLAQVRKERKLEFLRPDGKSQVSVRYREGHPVHVSSVLISTQHSPNVSHDVLREAIIEEVIKKVVPEQYLDRFTQIYVNPTGRFVIGGPQADCGLTGRKIIADTYGGYGRHGGGAFSGKDPSKVDRSACYMARYVAKQVVAAGLAEKCEIQVAYAIGVAEPVSLTVDTFGTGVEPESRLSAALRELFDFRPASIIRKLELKRPIYRPTAAYGHFGRESHNSLFTWERLDMVDPLNRAFGRVS
jgi:S-adenosylmethionine synthetase